MDIPKIDGYTTSLLSKSTNHVEFRIDISNEDEFMEWRSKYFLFSSATFSIKRTRQESAHNRFCQSYVCQHGIRKRASTVKQRKIHTK